MGNAHGHVINDTEERHRILTFNYGDEIRHEPANVYDIPPFQTVAVSAEMCPIRGLVVATGVAKSGKHHVLPHNGAIKISTLLREGDDNPAYQEAKQAIAQASGTNLPAVEARERYTSVDNDLREKARTAQKKYNRKPKRVFQDGVVEAIQSSLQASESISSSNSSKEDKKTKESNQSVEHEHNLAAPVTPPQTESRKKEM